MSNKKDLRPDMAGLGQKWLDVLLPFSYCYDSKLSGSEISRKVNIPQRTVSRYLNYLVKNSILSFEEKGNNKLYYLNYLESKTKIVLRLVENYKSFVFAQDNFLWKEIEGLINFGTVVVFGSRVKGYSNEGSDIDLVVFSRKSEKLKKVLRNLPSVEAQVISFDSFKKLVLEKDVLALEIMKSHVVFGNFDEFFDLCWEVYYG